MVVMILLIFCFTTLVGCSKEPRVNSGGPAIPIPVISGIIESIQPGNPSYAILKEVEVVKSDDSPELKRLSGNKFKLPSGHFISKDHWQSDGDTLDLFIGDQLVDFTKIGKILDESTNEKKPHLHFDGIVKSIKNNKMVIQKVFMVFDENHAFKGRKVSNEETTITIAPYTYVSLNGGEKEDSSQIKVGDSLLFILIGPPEGYIATQITDFHSLKDAGWHLVN